MKTNKSWYFDPFFTRPWVQVYIEDKWHSIRIANKRGIAMFSVQHDVNCTSSGHVYVLNIFRKQAMRSSYRKLVSYAKQMPRDSCFSFNFDPPGVKTFKDVIVKKRGSILMIGPTSFSLKKGRINIGSRCAITEKQAFDLYRWAYDRKKEIDFESVMGYIHLNEIPFITNKKRKRLYGH